MSEEQKTPQWLYIVIGIIFIFAAFIIFLNMVQKDNLTDGKAIESMTHDERSSLEAGSQIIQPSLGITPMQYKQQFNNASLMTDGSTFEIHTLEVKHGDVFDVANVELGKNNSMIVAVTKQGLVNSVTTISVGDGTIKSGANMLFLSAVMARSIHPNLDKQEAGKIGADLFTLAFEANGKPVTKVVNNVKHFATFSKELGYWYGIETTMN